MARRKAILIATGSEVEIALNARTLLERKGIGTRVVSMPCWELFATQDEKYRKSVLPAGPVRVGVEAALEFGWERWLCGERGSEKKAGFVGMTGFGASGTDRATLSALRDYRRGGGGKGRGAGLTAPPSNGED